MHTHITMATSRSWCSDQSTLNRKQIIFQVLSQTTYQNVQLLIEPVDANQQGEPASKALMLLMEHTNILQPLRSR